MVCFYITTAFITYKYKTLFCFPPKTEEYGYIHIETGKKNVKKVCITVTKRSVQRSRTTSAILTNVYPKVLFSL